ncbi:MAG: hypothetical protein BAJATHORv1_100004 [Candidatus Thorarchaeota archaeon]|nr:MAG: hypothetical protein BAJATHORv1_100004 [Candidatus Thorarchaeota archaeon]
MTERTAGFALHIRCISMQSLVSLALLTYILMMPLIANNPVSITYHNNPNLSADEPQLTLSYYSLWNTTPTPISSGVRISGDHVVLLAEWSPDGLVDNTSIKVHAPAIPITISNESTTDSVRINTRILGNNATCSVNVTAWLFNGSIISEVFTEVFIGNFFVPDISIITPTSDSVWTGVNNITWIASDLNSGDVLTYDVFLSSDSGQTYQVLASDLTKMWYEWNCTGLTMNDTYRVRVQVSDGIYSSFDTSETFTAGDVIITSTTTTTVTSTTTTTTDPDLITAAFIAAAIVSSGIMAIVVYYVARKWL